MAGSMLDPVRRFALFLLRPVFWLSNIVAIAVVLFGFLPLVVVPLVEDAVDGLARWDFVASCALLAVVPIATSAYAFAHRARYRAEPGELFELFFGVELPLVGLTVGRLVAFSALGHCATFVYGALAIGGVVAETRLILGKRLPQSQLLDGLSHFFLGLRMVAGVYVGFLLANLTLPIFASVSLHLLSNVLEDESGFLIKLPIVAIALTLAFLLATLPVTAPLAWWQALKHSGALVRARWGLDDLLFTSGAPVVVAALGFYLFVPQAHTAAFAQLATPPKDDAERRALAAAAPQIEEGLVEAWLGRHLYVADNTSDNFGSAWRLRTPSGVSFFSAADVEELNTWLNRAARPFTFDGIREVDVDVARRLYRAYFGREIDQDHARDAQRALAARWSRADRFNAFIDEGEDRARLVAQTVDVAGHDGVFDVEVHDVWQNQTPVDLEVTLGFALPVSAAISGVWVSPTERKEDGAAFTVSPRGAAQQTFEHAKRTRSDKPALVEQVGPGQYRFRVFPIPARTPRQRELIDSETWTAGDAAQVHVWIRYQALPDARGQAPFPTLTSRRNGFWDRDTVRVVDGVAVVAEDAHAGDVDVDVAAAGWVQGQSAQTQPHTVVMARVPHPVLASAPADPPASRFFGPGTSDRELAELQQALLAVPDAVPAPPPPSSDCVRLTPWPAPALDLRGQVVDVVIDRSRAVAAHIDVVNAALARLRAAGATLRFVLGTNALYGAPAEAVVDVDPAALAYVGAATPRELLEQLFTVRGAALGDAVVILTATTSFAAAQGGPLSSTLTALAKLPPVVVLHVSGTMPSGYDDETLDLVRQTGGTMSASLDEALARLSPLSYVDGYRVDVSDGCPDDGIVEPVVGRAAIALADRTQKAPPSELARLHAIATRVGVVTPYSSMIVLMNPAQRAKLAALARGSDAFTRELEGDPSALEQLTLRPRRLDDDFRGVSPPAAAAPATSGAQANELMKAKGDAALAAPKKQTVGDLGQAKEEQQNAPAQEPATTSSSLPTLRAELTEPAAVEAEVPSSPSSPSPSSPSSQPVQGVPEPQEWLLVALAAVAIAVVATRR